MSRKCPAYAPFLSIVYYQIPGRVYAGMSVYSYSVRGNSRSLFGPNRIIYFLS